MILPRSVLSEQRGSALLISLVMIVVITILGLALFQLGQIEGQQSGASLGDARAFELAQAGLERAIRELSNDLNADEAAPNGHGTESWVDGPNRPTCTPACGTAVYATMNLANTTLPAAGQDPGGSFTVELKQVLVAEANNPISQGAAYTYPYGQSCIPSAPTNPTVCANLMFVRSTGTAAGPPGYTATRTVQALVKAYSTSYFAGGLTAQQAQFGNDPAIDGRVLIAGSVHILGRSTISPAFQIDGGATMGMRNSWADLWPDQDSTPSTLRTLYRITPRQAICPTGANCTGGANLAESLGAELKIYGNVSNTMVNLRNSTNLGISTIQTASAYGDATVGSRYGKGFLDGVYVADGCVMPCTSNAFTFGGASAIYVDTNNYTKPYPYRPPKLPLNNQVNTTVTYPQLNTDNTVINGTTYLPWDASFFADHAWSNALLSGAPTEQPLGKIPPAILTTGRLTAGATINGGYCGPTYRTGDFSQVFYGGGLYADPTFGNNHPGGGFCHTFKFVNKAGVVTVGEICWRRNRPGYPSDDATNLPLNYDTVPTLEFGIPSCSAPNNPSNPLLIYHPHSWTLGYTSPQTDYQYRGSAIIFTDTRDIDIANTLQTTCSTPAATPPCFNPPERFPENSLLMLINQQAGSVSIANDNSGQPVKRFMGYVYSENAIQTQYATNLIGSFRAKQFCFSHSDNTNGCNGEDGAATYPKFFQVSFPDLRQIPAELPSSSGDYGNRWVVDVVPRFWIECRRGPGDVLPTTPTGTCQYQ